MIKSKLLVVSIVTVVVFIQSVNSESDTTKSLTISDIYQTTEKSFLSNDKSLGETTIKPTPTESLGLVDIAKIQISSTNTSLKESHQENQELPDLLDVAVESDGFITFSNNTQGSPYIHNGSINTTKSKLPVIGRSLDTGTVNDHSMEILAETSLSSINSSPFFGRGKFVKNAYNSKSDYDMALDRQQEGNFIVNADVYKTSRQSNKYNEPAVIETDITVHEDETPPAYGNPYEPDQGNGYDSGYSGGNSGYVYGDQSGANGGYGGHGGGSGGYGGNKHNMVHNGWSGGQNHGGYHHYDRPTIPMHTYSHPVPIIAEYRRPHHHKSMIDWHKIGILALLKIGLVKLKIFAFLKTVFMLLLKLKLFLIALFFKFLLLLKLMKFLKLLLVPLLLLALSPLLLPLLLPLILMPLYRLFTLLTEPVLVPSSANGTASSITRSQLDPLRMVDPGMIEFRNVLQSEKCVQRIACRMATTEQSGIASSWINWVLRRVTKYFSNKTLETYLTTYEDVNDYLYKKSPVPKDWSSWCRERYDCNNSENTISKK
ncbi:uncharacterized protein LOC126846534 [Adelges cooleyi]|uniref:uncharacterized protein LOC126846534 n=1 Tax=Adelges cooleyi TaxID=133065 RepID=UPI0021809235|nr:uncharacterized protein LOC126846534 [Adelges cooleyi]